MNRKLVFYDVTLRDALQAAPRTPSVKERVNIGRRIKDIGFDYVEAGFPFASEYDFQTVKELSSNIGGVVAFGRATKGDIDSSLNAFGNNKPILNLVSPVSREHIYKNLKLDFNTYLERMEEIFDYVNKETSKRGGNYMMIFEDSSRADKPFFEKLAKLAADNGAYSLTYADTVGIEMPRTISKKFSEFRNYADKKVLHGIHTHNDLGLATANSLEAVLNGADIVQTTIGTLGERAGNCSAETLIEILRQNKDLGIDVDIDTREYEKLNEDISDTFGISVPFNAPIVGKNAFTHWSGMHQNGDRKANLYRPVNPDHWGGEVSYGINSSSGSIGVKHVFSNFGIEIPESKLVGIVWRIKELSGELGRPIRSDDIQSIAREFELI